MLYVLQRVITRFLSWVIWPGSTSHYNRDALFATAAQRLQWLWNYTRKSITRILNRFNFKSFFNRRTRLIGEKMFPTHRRTSSRRFLHPSFLPPPFHQKPNEPPGPPGLPRLMVSPKRHLYSTSKFHVEFQSQVTCARAAADPSFIQPLPLESRHHPWLLLWLLYIVECYGVCLTRSWLVFIFQEFSWLWNSAWNLLVLLRRHFRLTMSFTV